MKEWYYIFHCWKFIDDNNLNESDALDQIKGMTIATSPVARIVKYSATNSYEPDLYYETSDTTTGKIDLDSVIYFKYSENYYYSLPISNRLIVFKDTLEKRFEDFNKLNSLTGGDVIDVSKYFTPITKEEYYSILTKEKEITVDELLNNM